MEALNCPKCGAPLSVETKQDRWLCIYCNSLVQVDMSQENTHAILEKSLSDEDLDEVKQLILSGRQSDAIEHYQQAAEVDLEEAGEAVRRLAEHISYSNNRQQILTSGGVVLVIIFSLIVLLSAVAGLTGFFQPLLAIVLVAFTFMQLVTLLPAIRNTLRFMRAPKAQAEVLNYMHIGQVKLGKEFVHTFKFLIEVRPADERPFQHEMVLPVRDKNIPRVRRGEMMEVKYILTDPVQLMFIRILSDDVA